MSGVRLVLCKRGEESRGFQFLADKSVRRFASACCFARAKFVRYGIVAGSMTPRQYPCQESSSAPAKEGTAVIGELHRLPVNDTSARGRVNPFGEFSGEAVSLHLRARQPLQVSSAFRKRPAIAPRPAGRRLDCSSRVGRRRIRDRRRRFPRSCMFCLPYRALP